MNKVIEFFKNRVVISIVGLIVLSFLIWFIGPAIKFGENNYAPLGSTVARLIVIMVIIVAWGLNNLRVQSQNKKQNEELVDGIQDSQNAATYGQNPEEMQQINDRFSQRSEERRVGKECRL